MTERLPRNLSPKAKWLLLEADDRAVVTALVKVGVAADREDLERRVTDLGGRVRSWSPGTGLVALELPAGQLGELAGLDGVVYVETGEAYRP